MFARFFIDRPVFATVLSIVIVLVGGVAVTQLPVAQYPEVAPPTVNVTANYPGANARTVGETVARYTTNQATVRSAPAIHTSRDTLERAFCIIQAP